MRLKGDELSAIKRGKPFVYKGLRPRQIIILNLAFANALIEQLTRRFFDRSEVASRDMGLQPSL